MATRYGSSLVDGINMVVHLLPGVGVTYMVKFLLIIDGEIKNNIFLSWNTNWLSNKADIHIVTCLVTYLQLEDGRFYKMVKKAF